MEKGGVVCRVRVEKARGGGVAEGAYSCTRGLEVFGHFGLEFFLGIGAISSYIKCQHTAHNSINFTFIYYTTT